MFFQRISNGWELAKESYHVLMLDKELLVFPLLSGLACLLVMASFALPLVGSDMLEQAMEAEGAEQNPLLYVYAFLFYFANYFVITFFNAALIACALIRFNGGDPTLGDGFRAASGRLPQIVAWALVSATVGLILRVIESYSEKAGRFVAGLLGMAWSAVSYFVVPVLVTQGVGPFEAIKKSFAVLRAAWGETLIANWSIGLIAGLVGLLAVIPIGLGLASGEPALMVVGIGIGVVWVMLVSLISTALNGIAVAAVYLYAAEDTTPEGFDGNLLRNAFVQR